MGAMELLAQLAESAGNLGGNLNWKQGLPVLGALGKHCVLTSPWALQSTDLMIQF